MTSNNKQVMMAFTEPQGLVYADAINLVSAVLTKDGRLIEEAVVNVLVGLRNGLYSMDDVKEMSNKIDHLANEFTK
jgi:hypothetical protein